MTSPAVITTSDSSAKPAPWLWRAASGQLQVRFLGFAPARREDALGLLDGPPARGLGWLRQVHSAWVREVNAGCEAGEGDALWSSEADLGVSVVTADCVPILLGGGGTVAAIHAGWRGIAADLIGGTLRELPVPAGTLEAWIGPAIGPCCYEVGQEVAERVVAAAGATVARPGPAGRPHLDLQAAAAQQLTRAGVRQVRTISHCTRCNHRDLASYRREGRSGARNLAVIWKTASPEQTSAAREDHARRPAADRTPR